MKSLAWLVCVLGLVASLLIQAQSGEADLDVVRLSTNILDEAGRFDRCMVNLEGSVHR